MIENSKSFFGDIFNNISKNNKKNTAKNKKLNYINDQDYFLFSLIDKNINININEKDGFIELSVKDKNREVSSLIAIFVNNLLQESIINFKIKNINDVYEFTSAQLEIAKKKLYIIQDSLAAFRDSNKNIKSDIFLNQENRIETEYNIAKNVYNELALTKEKSAIDVRKNTPIFTIINEVVVPNKYSNISSLNIILYFTIVGFTLSSIYVIILNYYPKFIKFN